MLQKAVPFYPAFKRLAQRMNHRLIVVIGSRKKHKEKGNAENRKVLKNSLRFSAETLAPFA